MACDTTQLLADAKCIETCVPAGAMPAVIVSLLCQLAGGGSGTGPYVLKTGDTMSGSLAFTNLTTNHVEVPFVWGHFADANNNTEPVVLELYHETSGGAGGGANNNGVSMDFRADSATLDRQLGVRFSSFYTNATQATLTSELRVLTVVNAVTTECLRMNNVALDLRNGTVLQVAGTQVVSARNTGWTTFTGASTKNAGGFDTGTVTTPQLASVVKAMFDALVTHGLIGA